MKGILIALVLSMFSSCVGKEIQATIAEVKIPQVEYQAELVGILDSFLLLDTPIHFDTAFFKRELKFDFENGNLSPEIVQVLTQKFAKDEISARENYYVNAFLEIEEAKAKDQYATYQENLDPGMTENAVCRSIGRVEIGDSVGLLLWEIKYESFAACPLYQGHHVLGTLVYKGQTISTMHLASNVSGSDAPVRFESFQLASILKNGELHIRNFAQTYEENDLIESSSSKTNYLFSSKGFEIKK